MTTDFHPTDLHPTPPAPRATSPADRELYFSDPHGRFGADVVQTLHSDRSDSPDWPGRVRQMLTGSERAVVVLSFEADGPALAHRVTDLRPGPTAIVQPAPATRRRHWVHAHPAPAAYADMVRSALQVIGDGDVDKVVLGRGLHILSDPHLSAEEVLARLVGGPGTRPAGRYAYSVPLADPSTCEAGVPRLVGASPELLVRRRGTHVEATPLAGSVPRHADAAEDARRRSALLESRKDLAEHRHVVDDLVARLGEGCVDVVAAPTGVVGTDTMWHLGTTVTARVRRESLDQPRWGALGLTQLVHPTPAVGGVPRADALALVADLEGEPRGWFGGAVGWVDAAGDGEFALTLRSGILDGGSLRLWAGAGIVAGSVPEDEVAETGAKLATMSRAVGL